MNSQRLSSEFIPHIQGLRGIAIILVFLYHYVPNICPNGYIGVDLFFVISGYFLFRKGLNGVDINIRAPLKTQNGERVACKCLRQDFLKPKMRLKWRMFWFYKTHLGTVHP